MLSIVKAHSPTLEGFKAVARRPSIALAEIAWRWSFGAAAIALLTYLFLEYLNTLPVTRAEVLLLRTRQPNLVARALQHIFAGSGWRMVQASMVLILLLATGWIVIASLGRAATVRALIGYFQSRPGGANTQLGKAGLGALFGLNSFRVGITVAAVLGFMAALVLRGAIAAGSHPWPGAAFLAFLAVAATVWLLWQMLNWFLMLASVFAATRGENTFGSVVAAVDFCLQRTGPVFAVGTWFGLSDAGAFVVATAVAMTVLGFSGLLPAGVILFTIALVTLFYFAVADYLYMGRLAAYVAILEWPEAPVPVPPVFADRPAEPAVELSAAVDASELILSDVPNPPESH